MERLIKNQLYKIWWNDIFTDNQWEPLKAIVGKVLKVKPQINSWYFIAQTPGWYIFSSSLENEDGNFYDYHALPRGVIIKVKKMK